MIFIYDKKTAKGNFGTNGLGITEAQWAYLGLSNKKIRIAWYM